MRPTNIVKRLPPDEQRQLNELLSTRPKGLTSVAKIHKHLNLRQRYGIPLVTLYAYTRRLREEATRAEADASSREDLVSAADRIDLPAKLRAKIDRAIIRRPPGLVRVAHLYDHFKLREHKVPKQAFERYCRYVKWKNRLAAKGKLVGELFHGSMEQMTKDCNSTFLRLVSAVLESVENDEMGISTADLLKLSKILAEQRRAAAKEMDVRIKSQKVSADSKQPAGAASAQANLPDNFADVVKNVYGLALQDAARKPRPPEPTSDPNR